MQVRVVYLKTPGDGFCISESISVPTLPRVGDLVCLPDELRTALAEKEPTLRFADLGAPLRYVVVGIEHCWHKPLNTPNVLLTKLHNPEFPATQRDVGA